MKDDRRLDDDLVLTEDHTLASGANAINGASVDLVDFLWPACFHVNFTKTGKITNGVAKLQESVNNTTWTDWVPDANKGYPSSETLTASGKIKLAYYGNERYARIKFTVTTTTTENTTTQSIINHNQFKIVPPRD